MSSSLTFQYLVTLNMASRDETFSLSVTESSVSSTRILTRTAWSSRAAAQVRWNSSPRPLTSPGHGSPRRAVTQPREAWEMSTKRNLSLPLRLRRHVFMTVRLQVRTRNSLQKTIKRNSFKARARNMFSWKRLRKEERSKATFATCRTITLRYRACANWQRPAGVGAFCVWRKRKFSKAWRTKASSGDHSRRPLPAEAASSSSQASPTTPEGNTRWSGWDGRRRGIWPSREAWWLRNGLWF